MLEFLKKEYFSGRENEFEKRRTDLMPLSQTRIIKIERKG